MGLPIRSQRFGVLGNDRILMLVCIGGSAKPARRCKPTTGRKPSTLGHQTLRRRGQGPHSPRGLATLTLTLIGRHAFVNIVPAIRRQLYRSISFIAYRARYNAADRSCYVPASQFSSLQFPILFFLPLLTSFGRWNERFRRFGIAFGFAPETLHRIHNVG